MLTNTHSTFKQFPAKVLLFGEHIVNLGAKGLAIPYNAFFCELTFNKTAEFALENSHLILTKIADYLSQEDINEIDLPAFNKAIANGLTINMNIPVGYGAGSSGALVACIFDAFSALSKTENLELTKLKTLLGKIESVFHGKSSGLDPLVCYLKQAVLIEQNKQDAIIDKVSFPNHWHLFLVDSETPRSTEKMVNLFLDTSKKPALKQAINNELVPLNNALINAFTQNEWAQFNHKIQALSTFHYAHFNPLILPELKAIWQQGLNNNNYYLKICGAGGGGFYLGFTQQKNETKQAFANYNLLWL